MNVKRRLGQGFQSGWTDLGRDSGFSVREIFRRYYQKTV
jgi:hypothetical protein